MNRQQQLNNKLSKTIYNQSCKHSELDNKLNEISQCIIDVVFEEEHGEYLKLDDVIEHLKKQIERCNLTDNNVVISMLDVLKQFKEYVIRIKKGTKGERIANNKLSLLKQETYCKILNNLVLDDGIFQTEIDNVVITNKGIFLIETKMRNGNMKIIEGGLFAPAKGRITSYNSFNILDQLDNQETLIKEFLREKGFKLNNCLIHPYIFFANKDYTVDDYRKDSNVLYTHNLNSTILENGSFINLSNEEIDEYEKVLKKLEIDETREIDFDLDDLRNKLISGIILLEKNLDNKLDDEEEKTEWHIDIKSTAIGCAVTSLIYGTVELAKYYLNSKAYSR